MANMVFTASRSAGDDISVPISIPFTVGGTATFTSDYTVTGANTFTASSGSMTIPAGQTSAAITISTVPDTIFEPDETIILTPTAQAGVWIVGASSWTGTIINDDAASNLILSLNFEGANNSTTFTDLSTFNRVGTTSGNAKITNASPISGSSSGLFDGTSGTFLFFPTSLDFALGAGNFSASFRIRTTQSAGFKGLVSRIANPGTFSASGSWVIYINAGIVQVFASDYSTSNPLVTSSTAINDGLVHKIEFRRIGTAISLLIDDVSVVSVTSSVIIADNGSPLYIATDRNNGVTGSEYNGLIDDLIITKG